MLRMILVIQVKFKLSIKVTIDIVTRTNIVFSIQNTIF